MANKNTPSPAQPRASFLVRSVQAAQHFDALSLSFPASGGITASTTSRTLAGTIVEYDVLGHTSAGPLRVARGALNWSDDLTRVKLTREHDRGEVRGHATLIAEPDPKRLRGAFRVSDGVTGDLALTEAADHTRDAFSIDVVDATVDGDTITSATLIAVGQVGIPAFAGALIDTIAAARAADTERNNEVTEEQRNRLAVLRATQNRTPEQETELADLATMETAAAEAAPAEAAPAEAAAAPPAAVAASRPFVPTGVPAPSRAPPPSTGSSRRSAPRSALAAAALPRSRRR